MKAIVARDAEIQLRVLQELKWDTRVEETDIGVEVDAGIVTLTGRVGSYAEKLAAQEAAHRVAEVLDVANEIEVTIPGDRVRTDADIAQAVRHALSWNVLVPDDRIQSTVADGWVTLEGTVYSLRQRIDAETAVRFLVGVRGVTNLITVSAPQPRAEDVRAEIMGALERRADRAAKRIQIDVDDNQVMLTGTVGSWFEKEAVIGVVRHAPGIREVVDRLKIDPYYK